MESEQSESVAVQKRRALWPWVVSALVAIVFAVGLSFWWPMYRAGRVIEFVETNEGYCDANYHHPEWMNFVLDEHTFHPWFDEMESIDAPDIVATQSLLDDLKQFENLTQLALRIDRSPLEKFRQFGSLELLCLYGEHSNVVDLFHIDDDFSRQGSGYTEFSRNDWKNLVADLNVRAIIIDGCRVQGTVVANSQIEILYLMRCQITGSAGEAISGLSGLDSLALNESIVEPGFWKNFRNHPSLNSLELNGCPLGGSSWENLCQIASLRNLQVSFTWVSNALIFRPEFDQLGPPNQPNGTFPINDEWSHVSNLKNLEGLWLENVLVSTELSQALSALPNLQAISFENVTFDGQGLDHLKRLSTLKHLSLYNTKVTAAELKAFREKRPDVEIDHDIEGILSDRRAKQLINAGP